MTEKKKRGLLSWLGFGEEEQSPKTQNEANVENVEEQTEVGSPVEAEQVAPETEVAKPVEPKPVESEQALEETQEEQQPVRAEAEAEAEQEEVALQVKVEEVQEKPTESFFARLKRSLSRTKANIGAGFFGLFKGKQIDEELFEELEEQLLIADVGMNTTVKIIENLTEKASRNDLKDGEALYGLLKEEMADILSQVEQPLVVDTTKTPYVILMVGVNGVGKTTTIGKLAKQFQSEGKKVMLAAGDTFRAAAVEQLQVWGQRNDVPVIAAAPTAEPAPRRR